MNDELISEIYRSRESSSYEYFLKSKEVQETYWENFMKDFGRLVDQNNREQEEEHQTFIKLKEMVESEIFQHLLENDRYREKIDSIFSRDQFVMGKSNIKLMKLCRGLSGLCNNYTKEYKNFIAEAEKKMRADIVKFDTDSKIIFESIFDANACTENFFNMLCNNKLV